MVYHTASSSYSVYLSEEEQFEPIPYVQNCSVEEPIEEFELRKGNKPTLFPLLVRVFHTLDIWVTRRVTFSLAVDKYGFPHSISSFGIMVHMFSSAGMHNQVYCLLMEIVLYYERVGYDTFALFPTLLELSNGVERSLAVFDVLMKVYASSLMLENAVDVFVQVKGIGLQPGLLSCNFMLKCLVQGNKAEYITSVFDVMKNSGPQPDEYTYTIVLNFYCRQAVGQACEYIGKATELIEEMMRCGVSPTVVTYGTYLHGLCRNGMVDSALNLLSELRQRNQHLSSTCYNAVIRGLCRKGEVNEAARLMEEMKSSGVSPDVHSYSILIDGFCKMGNVLRGLDLLEEMKTSGLRPSLVSYTPLLDGLCKSGLAEFAVNLFKEIGAFGYRHDKTSYSILIECYCKLGDLDAACKVMNEMLGNNLFPDVYRYTNVLHGYCKVGRLDEALGLFKQGLKGGMRPNVVTCTVIVDGFCKKGRVEEAILFMDEMQDQGIIPDLFTYNAIINGLCKELKSNSAQEIYQLILERTSKLCKRMLKDGKTPNVVTYTILISAFCCGGRMYEALKVFKEMIVKGIVPDKIAFTAIIAGYCRIGDTKTALDFYREMEKRGITPDIFTYTCLVHGYCKSKQMDEARNLFDRIIKSDTPNVVTYTALMAGYHRTGDLEIALQLYNKMEEKGIQPDDITCLVLGLGTVQDDDR
ncbi:hypothetical protein IFM89_022716 [Coptis chinensis]|uniref:Pentatricopeptide repeat-containing protein n=1 Tax=Coptis chinensis TaxID=261450 RepID=A0A835IC63_9MAGN|nr:hypothetical protein IFM89_022716 [Coptis chinensis]